jgi:hypothetical protein
MGAGAVDSVGGAQRGHGDAVPPGDAAERLAGSYDVHASPLRAAPGRAGRPVGAAAGRGDHQLATDVQRRGAREVSFALAEGRHGDPVPRRDGTEGVAATTS